MEIQVRALEPQREEQFRQDMQEAFQKGFEAVFGPSEQAVLPARDIADVRRAPGAASWEALLDGELVGGAVTVVQGEKGELGFLYVKNGLQGKKIGQKIWQFLENRYPEVREWETVTSYFEKRNLHFYLNCCGFAAVAFYDPRHPDPRMPPQEAGNEAEDCFFRFVKKR